MSSDNQPMFEEAEPAPEQVPPRPQRRAWLLVLVLALLALAIAATALVLQLNRDEPEPTQPGPSPTEPSTDPEPTEPTEPTDNPEQTPPEPLPALVIADCPTLNPPAQRISDEFVTRVGMGPDHFTPPPGPVGRDAFDREFGPVAQSTMNLADRFAGCYYLFSFHDAQYNFVTDIEPGDTQTLIDALRADSRFVEDTIGLATRFVATETSSSEIGEYTYMSGHAFLANAWVSASGSGGVSEGLEAMLEALIAANPHLATGRE